MKEVIIFRANEALNAETKDSTNQNLLEPDTSNIRLRKNKISKKSWEDN